MAKPRRMDDDSIAGVFAMLYPEGGHLLIF
nr:MAG TPA: hypothetical protein [Caudoviricetes sp.]